MKSNALDIIEEQARWKMLGEFSREPPVKTADVMQAALDVGLKVDEVHNDNLLKLHVPRSLVFRHIYLLHKTIFETRESIITFYGTSTQSLFIAILTVLLSLFLLSLFVISGVDVLIKGIVTSKGEFSIFEIKYVKPILTFSVAILFLLAYEVERRRCFLIRLPKKLGVERRLLGSADLTEWGIRRDLISVQIMRFLLIPAWIITFPTYWAFLIFTLFIVLTTVNLPAMVQHPLVQQRIKRLRGWTDCSFDHFCLLTMGVWGTIFAFLQWGLIYEASQHPPDDIGIPASHAFVTQVIRWIFGDNPSLNDLHDFRHAIQLRFSSIEKAHKFQEYWSQSYSYMVWVPLAFLLFCILPRFWLRIDKNPVSVFLGIVPEMRSWRTRIAVIYCWGFSLFLTCIAFYMAISSWIYVISPGNGEEIPISKIVNPVRISSVLVPFLDDFGQKTLVVLALSFSLPALFILFELSIILFRELLMTFHILHSDKKKDNRIVQLQEAWAKQISTIKCPRLYYTSNATLPEVRYTLLPPFKYIALPIWFRSDIFTGVLKQKEMTALLAHEYYHYVHHWKRKVILRGLSLLIMRCPDAAFVFSTGTDELEADEYASYLLGGELARESVAHAISNIASVRARCTLTSKESFLSKVGDFLLPKYGGFAPVYPKDEMREALLAGESHQKIWFRKRSQSFLDVAFSTIIAAISILTFMILQGQLKSVSPSELPGKFERVFAPVEETSIRDLASSDEKLHILYKKDVIVFDPQTEEIKKTVKLPCENPWRILPLMNSGYVLGSAWRGAWFLLDNHWEEVSFGRNESPAVLDICQINNGEIFLATTDGLWRIEKGEIPIRAYRVYGAGMIFSAVRPYFNGLMLGTTQGLISLVDLTTPEKILDGHVLALDTKGNDWIAAWETDSPNSNILIGGSVCDTIPLFGIAGGVNKLLIGNDGVTWLVCGWQTCLYGTIATYKNRQWDLFEEIPSEDNFRCIVQVAGQTYVSEGSRLMLAKEGSLTQVDIKQGQPNLPVAALAFDFTRWPWIAANGFVWRFDGAKWLRIGRGVPDSRYLQSALFLCMRKKLGIWMVSQQQLVAMDEKGEIIRISVPKKKRERIIAMDLREDDTPLILLSSGKIFTLKNGEWCQLADLEFDSGWGEISSIQETAWCVIQKVIYQINLETGTWNQIEDPTHTVGPILPLSKEQCLIGDLNGLLLAADSYEDTCKVLKKLDGRIVDLWMEDDQSVTIVTRRDPMILRWINKSVEPIFTSADGLPYDIQSGGIDRSGRLWGLDNDGDLWWQIQIH